MWRKLRQTPHEKTKIWTRSLNDRCMDDIVFKVARVFSGFIKIIGPSYNDIIGVPGATRAWSTAISECKVDMETLRRKNEGFIRVHLDLDISDLNKVSSIDTHTAWPTNSKLQNGDSGKETIEVATLGSKQSWPILLSRTPLAATEDGVIGLVPNNAQPGGKIFQFSNSDVVAVVRLEDGGKYAESLEEDSLQTRHLLKAQIFMCPLILGLQSIHKGNPLSILRRQRIFMWAYLRYEI